MDNLYIWSDDLMNKNPKQYHYIKMDNLYI
jgi:hypothetical protein